MLTLRLRVVNLLKVCWSTIKLHTTPSWLRPRAKPFPLRTMSKDSAECKQVVDETHATVHVWSFLLRLWRTARFEKAGQRLQRHACVKKEQKWNCDSGLHICTCGFTQDQKEDDWKKFVFPDDTYYLEDCLSLQLDLLCMMY